MKRASRVLLAAVCGTVTFAIGHSADAQSLSPYGMWSERDQSFRARRYRDDDRRYEAPRRSYRERYERDYGYADDDYWYDPEQRSPRARSNGKPQLSEDVRNGGARPIINAVAPPQVAFAGNQAQGSIVIDVSKRKLYYITAPGQAFEYSIGVGREGFSWTGTETVSRIADWPDWHPPAEMRMRQPELPSKMLGGIRNPLGAKAIYLGTTLYRIHGTNDAKSIGSNESSGCFRMLNEHVIHLASLVQVGAQVSVVKSLSIATAAPPPVAANPVPRKPAVVQQRPRDDWRDNYPYDDEPVDERYYDPRDYDQAEDVFVR